MKISDARNLIIDYIKKAEKESGMPLVVFNDETVETEFGWAFFYGIDPERSPETLFGNGPILVDRNSAKLIECGSAESPETYIDAYSKTRSIDHL